MFLVKMADDLLWTVLKAIGGNTEDWTDILGHYVRFPSILITRDGGCLTLLEGRGLKELPYDVMPSMIADLSEKFSGPFAGGHVITIDFERDPDEGARIVQENMSYARTAIREFHLDLENLLDERENVLAQYVSYEKTWIGLWTPPTAGKRIRKEHEKELKKRQKKAPEGFESFIDMSEMIIQKHQAFVDLVISELDRLKYVTKTFNAHEAIRETRKYLFGSITSQQWKPVLLGDKVRPGILKRYPPSPEDLLRPSLGRQIVPQDISIEDGYVRMDNRYYKVMGMKIAPGQTEPFSRFISAMNIPFKMHMRLSGGGVETVEGMKYSMSRALSWDPVSSNNRQIVSAIDALRYYVENHGFVVDMRLTFATWGSDTESAARNASELYQKLSGWGTGAVPEISEQLGRPARSLVRMAPGSSSSADAWCIPAPISEALWMAPFPRSGSPWEQGPLEFRTDDEKFYPVDPVSSKQTAHFTICFAPMRMGKSLMSNGRALSLCLRPGGRLPRILIIDVGWSSSGLISLLKYSVRPEDRGLFQHYRVQMDKNKFGFNPFDLPVGFRTPLPNQRQFLNNLMMILCTPSGLTAPPEPVPGFLGKLIDASYEQAGPNKKPKRFNEGVDKIVTDAVKKYMAETPDTWWEAMDGLFRAGQADIAERAGRYAVPTLNDLAGNAKDKDIGSMYLNAIVDLTKESVSDFVLRSVTEAIRDFPILSVPTKFETGDARIMAFDLGDVTQTSPNPKDHKQAAVMYMLARQMGGRDFYLSNEAIASLSPADLPLLYRHHHETRLKEMKEDRKDIVFDEFHRTGGHAGIRSQVILDVREGPKHNVSISLFSQMAEDFDDTMRTLAQTVYILGAGQGDEVDKVVELFKFSKNVEHILRKSMYKPDRGGSHVFARYLTDKGTFEAKLRYTRGPMELWAFSTTPVDNALRDRLYEMIGADEARRRLAIKFPGGTAEDEINRRISLAVMKGGGDSEGITQTIMDDLIGEITSMQI